MKMKFNQTFFFFFQAVWDYKQTPNFAEAVIKATEGCLVDVVFDIVGGDVIPQVIWKRKNLKRKKS